MLTCKKPDRMANTTAGLLSASRADRLDRQGVSTGRDFNSHKERCSIQCTLNPVAALGFQIRLCCRLGRLVSILQHILKFHFLKGMQEGVSVL